MLNDENKKFESWLETMQVEVTPTSYWLAWQAWRQRAGINAQQNMHLTSGSLRGLWASFWLRVLSALKHFTTPPTGR